MGPSNKLLVFAGSTRAGSWNRKLAGVAADLARTAGATVSHIELADFELPIYNADLEARGTPEAAIRLKELFHAHPGWIICSPEYNASYTALLKNTIDWVSSPVKGHPQWSSGTLPFEGKVVGLLSASPGALGGLQSLSHLAPLLANLQCWVAPTRFSLSRAGEAFDADGRLASEGSRERVRAVVEQVLWASQRLHCP
ncbi:MAG TPA: NAD(P)H-dependent oxidoreductase [Burkholderiaceae bacterium]|jgi:chromate reductase|nr:NAD(P)H-dependent oxidoreductase [Burkholderiaceae bacterium]HOS85763.1 NAD(P)H-dependent oxidoreductase [Burkholderiaceae bacterium]HPL78064.1 NAD(P)H-dependent oxidoreductase [Burkholderiaceae bacterium]